MLVGRPLGAFHREVLLRRGSTLCTIRFPARPACRWTNAAAAAWMCVLSALLGSPRRCPLRSLLSSLAWFPVLRLQVAEMVLTLLPPQNRPCWRASVRATAAARRQTELVTT